LLIPSSKGLMIRSRIHIMSLGHLSWQHLPACYDLSRIDAYVQ
jgi:hypothetical protein